MRLLGIVDCLGQIAHSILRADIGESVESTKAHVRGLSRMRLSFGQRRHSRKFFSEQGHPAAEHDLLSFEKYHVQCLLTYASPVPLLRAVKSDRMAA